MQPGWHNNSPRKRAFWGCKQNFKTYNPPAGGIVRIEKRVEPTSLEENPVLVRDFSGRFNTSYSGDFKSPKLAGKKRVFVPSFEALDKKFYVGMDTTEKPLRNLKLSEKGYVWLLLCTI